MLFCWYLDSITVIPKTLAHDVQHIYLSDCLSQTKKPHATCVPVARYRSNRNTGFMTNAAAGLPGQPATLAAHQIALSLFFFASPFMEVISQTAQTFLPSYDVRPDDADPDEWRAASNSLVYRLERMGLGVGAIMAAVLLY